MNTDPKYKKGDYLFIQVRKDKYLVRITNVKNGTYTMLHEDRVRKGVTNMQPLILKTSIVDAPNMDDVKVTKLTKKEVGRYMLLFF